jgi:hypothetical protein
MAVVTASSWARAVASETKGREHGGSRQWRGAPAASECGGALLPAEKRNRTADGGCSRQARLMTSAVANARRERRAAAIAAVLDYGVMEQRLGPRGWSSPAVRGSGAATSAASRLAGATSGDGLERRAPSSLGESRRQP